MKTLATGIFTISVCLLLAFILSMPVSAQTKTPIGGKFMGTFAEQHQYPIGDVADHMITVGKSTGIDSSTTPAGFMNGADVVNYSVGDLTKGNGHQFGYVIFIKGADTTYAKWEHNLTTTMTAEGKPQMTFKGTFTFESGTGQYKGIQGGGSFTGIFTSLTEYNVSWQGEYAIAKAMPMK
jgi:hypothetical protein